MRRPAASACLRVALLPLALAGLGCDGSDAKAALTIAYAAETATPTDVYVAQRRVLDDALAGAVAARETDAQRVRLNLVPQRPEGPAPGPQPFFEFDEGAYFVVVVGAAQATGDTLAAVAFEGPSAGTLRLVNAAPQAVEVTVGPATTPPTGLPRTRLDGLGAVSPPLPAAAGHVVTVFDPSTGLVRYTHAVTATPAALALGVRQGYAFTPQQATE